ncbi:MAG: putative Uroporphyrinogen-III decarboxylase-like protein [Holophagaceae bacterium]|nr:putative Uroporphyrinogen-III decarboxylase-like protein [Holophagaceae bacterium]
MKTPEELLNERLDRLKKTIRLEKTDRTPVVLMADSFFAKERGRKIADLCKGIDLASDIMCESAVALGGDLDGVNSAFPAGPLFPLIFMTKVKLPGRELPDDALWQLDEREVMTQADYDTILAGGWNNFMPGYVMGRLGVDLPTLGADLANAGTAVQKFEANGMYVYSELVTITVNEYLSGGRSMGKFMRDIFTMPDKVEEVLNVIQKENLEQLRGMIRASKGKSPVVFVSPARGASEFYSPKLWERFVFRFIKETVDMVNEEGYVCDIHADGNWERDLDYFRAFKPGSVIFESDGVTDMAKIREKLGGHVAIKGDVPAGMLVLGNPDQVHKYCTDMIKANGPGFILSCGCSCPPNAKVENVKAMISAATGK